MDNIFDLRRYANIASPQVQEPLPRAYRNLNFGPTMLQTSDFPARTSQTSDSEDPILSLLGQRPGGRAIDAYRAHLDKLPQQQDYAPSKWRRLGSAIAAGAASFGRTPQNALEIGAQMRDAPYQNALQNWQVQGAGLKEQAGLEAADQTAQIARMKQILDYKDKLADNARQDAAQKATESYQQGRLRLMAQQGWIKDYDQQGNLIMINPTSGERVNYGPSSKYTDLVNDVSRVNQGWYGLGQGDRRIAQGDQQLAISRGQLGVAQGNLGVNQGNLANAQNRTGIMEKESNARIAGMGNNQLSGNEQFAGENYAVRNVIRAHPEWADYINESGAIKLPSEYTSWGGLFSGTPPTVASDPEYKKFIDAVDAEKRKVYGTRPPGSYTP